jgi:mono/diheme cytochrome c family protein
MRILAAIGFIGIVGAIVAAIFFFAGFYSVAATVEDPGIVAWALVHVRQASIERHATESPPRTFNDQSTVQAGARAFAARGCINCHGGPGADWAKFSEGMNPGPADLKEIAGERAPGEIFWVIKNGIRMTGMPGFGSVGVDDAEIWSITAFVKKLPGISDSDFKQWSADAGKPGG